MRVYLLFILFLALPITGCTNKPHKLILHEKEFSNLSGWKADSHYDALLTFVNSCEKLEKINSDKQIILESPAEDWHNVCFLGKQLINKKLPKSMRSKAARHFFEENFMPFLATNNNDKIGMFTGYYELELKGSKRKSSKFKHPVYALPSVKKGYSRSEINAGALKNKKLEIAYVADPVRLFFLQIQGSGIIRLEDGQEMRVGYAGQNGHDYVSIGKVLIDDEVIERADMTAQVLMKWLYENPQQATDLMNKNSSYIYFKELTIPTHKGPIGAQGISLVAERSLAVDKRFIPYGTPVWLESSLPVNYKNSYKRLMVAQDTGGAIKGPVRGDVFFGRGRRAEHLAGNMKQEGQYYILLPKRKEFEAIELSKAKG